MARTAFLTGATGQDGFYLAKLLLDKKYRVHVLRQPSALPDLINLAPLAERLVFHYGDMTDASSLRRAILSAQPDEVYNLAAQSHVGVSFEAPEYTADVNAIGTLRLLEILRTTPGVRFFQASTSEMFGDAPPPQSERSPMRPLSPYAAAKKYAYDMVRIYREAYGLFAANGIMFNHESPRRGEDFVTRKIARAVAEILKNNTGPLLLGNLDARRDWSHAEDIMRGAWLVMQQDKADDFVLASGESRSVRDFATAAFAAAEMTLRWSGQGQSETGTDSKSGRIVVAVDPRLFRPLDVENLRGDASYARDSLGWKPQRSFENLVAEMVDAEMALR